MPCCPQSQFGWLLIPGTTKLLIAAQCLVEHGVLTQSSWQLQLGGGTVSPPKEGKRNPICLTSGVENPFDPVSILRKSNGPMTLTPCFISLCCMDGAEANTEHALSTSEIDGGQ